MRISRAAVAATVLVGATAAGFGLSIGTASAEDVKGRLAITSFGDMVVDSVHKRVFISDPTWGQIIVTTYRGEQVGSVKALYGVNGLALSGDSSTLHAAVPGMHSIVDLSTTTLEVTKLYALGSGRYPETVTEAGGKLWFGYDTNATSNTAWGGRFGSVDPVTSEVTAYNLGVAGTYQPPEVASNPSAPGVLVVGEGTSFWIYDVSSGTAVQTYTKTTDGSGGSDFAVSPDGKFVYRIGAATTRVSLDDLKLTQVHGTAGGIAMVAADDGRIITGEYNTDGDPDVLIYTAGADAPETSIALPTVETNYHQTLYTSMKGLTAEADGPRVFSVGEVAAEYWFFTSNNPDPIVTVTVPETAPRAKPLTVTGTITAGLALPENPRLTLVRTDVESPSGAVIGTTTADAAGAFSFTDVPPAGGTVGYTVSFAGSGGLNAASGTGYVTVPRLTPALTFTPSAVYAYGTTATFTAKLGTTYKNRAVEIWADPAGTDQQNRLLVRATVNSAGKVSVKFRLTRTTTLVGRFTGDAGYLSRSVTSHAYTKVAAATKLTRHYKTAKIGSTTYQYFRKSKDPLITQTMTASPGRKVRTTIQVLSGGEWVLWSARDTTLSSAGKASFTFVTGAKVGKRYRVRAEYLPGKSGDSLNHTTVGGWKYFTYTA